MSDNKLIFFIISYVLVALIFLKLYSQVVAI